MRSIVRCVAAQSRDPEGDTSCPKTWAPALQCIVQETLRCVQGTNNVSAFALPCPSLRAQRSNPESLRGKTLDCFAALANDEASGNYAILQSTS